MKLFLVIALCGMLGDCFAAATGDGTTEQSSRVAITKDQLLDNIKSMVPEAVAARYARDLNKELKLVSSNLDAMDSIKYPEFLSAVRLLVPSIITDSKDLVDLFKYVFRIAKIKASYAEVTDFYQHLLSLMPDEENRQALGTTIIDLFYDVPTVSPEVFRIAKKYLKHGYGTKQVNHLMQFLMQFLVNCGAVELEVAIDELADATGLSALAIVEPLFRIKPENHYAFISQIRLLKNRTNGTSEDSRCLLKGLSEIKDVKLYDKFNSFSERVCVGVNKKYVADVIYELAVGFEQLVQHNKLNACAAFMEKLVGTAETPGLGDQSRLSISLLGLLEERKVPFSFSEVIKPPLIYQLTDDYLPVFTSMYVHILNNCNRADVSSFVYFMSDLSEVDSVRLTTQFIDYCVELNRLSSGMRGCILALNRVAAGHERNFVENCRQILPYLNGQTNDFVYSISGLQPALWPVMVNYLRDQHRDFFEFVSTGIFAQELSENSPTDEPSLIRLMDRIYRQYFARDRRIAAGGRSVAMEVHRFSRRTVPAAVAAATTGTPEASAASTTSTRLSSRTFNDVVITRLSQILEKKGALKLTFADSVGRMESAFFALISEQLKQGRPLHEYLDRKNFDRSYNFDGVESDQNVLSTVVSYLPDDQMQTWLQTYLAESRNAYDSNGGGESCQKGVLERAITALRNTTVTDSGLQQLFAWAEKSEMFERKKEVFNSPKWPQHVFERFTEMGLNFVNHVGACDAFKQILEEYFADSRTDDNQQQIDAIIAACTEIDEESGLSETFNQFFEQNILPLMRNQYVAVKNYIQQSGQEWVRKIRALNSDAYSRELAEASAEMGIAKECLQQIIDTFQDSVVAPTTPEAAGN